MDKIDFYMNEFVKDLKHKSIFEYLKNVNQGKRLRSKLILKIAQPSDEAYKLCAVIECIHLASLMHDDVIDEALTRRNTPSINAIYGDKTAIMLGDILYSIAFYNLTSFKQEISACVGLAVALLSSGELLDVELGESFNEDENKYYEMIYKKTSSLIEASAYAAALLVDKKDALNYKEFGKNLGIAFQIVDDILDITQDEATLGKPNLNDYKEGKVTLPYIMLDRALKDEDKKRLRAYFAQTLNKEEQSWIKEQFAKYDIINKSIKIAQEYGEKALKCVDNPDLQDIVKKMIFREF
ncbi:polyprenyl synthetase family protein [Campylobacter canadensis]|uniref:Polyprenyl synthetase family protein n=1 Tax=Campylobacter canadensis TaxID=449520 RepID=A0ABS7WTI0_9BACT|nr:polyprenyl synthetase family protein [Campylobacter canadensis]MBZ7987234.1 polyprenyl synthetase family protein [Campylobacter canadensis]MBZ7994312.1 polyprenyl synthetase family protein [Campylobacter canadensis]MBZ7996008.1 polyprenyl synthetase family protein [Campylobacter canadensis]MBZ7998337.1 polyprenyl synthetase family protein [Campylobacter canadensis]MBZ7999644.1 polyprenyl synthetase family protein [Campylobacter canadensis]